MVREAGNLVLLKMDDFVGGFVPESVPESKPRILYVFETVLT